MKTKILFTSKTLQTSAQILKSEACGKSCNSCTISVPRIIECYECTSGYKLIDKKCVKCSLEGCGNCEEFLNLCEYCGMGYFNSSENGSSGYTYVSKCSKCEKHCKKCENGTSCSECLKGFHLDGSKCVGGVFYRHWKIYSGLIAIIFLILICYFMNKINICELLFSSWKNKRRQKLKLMKRKTILQIEMKGEGDKKEDDVKIVVVENKNENKAQKENEEKKENEKKKEKKENKKEREKKKSKNKKNRKKIRKKKS